MSARLLTLAEFADTLRVSPHTIRKWVHQGKLTPVRVCRKLLFEPADVERLIEESRRPPESSRDFRRNLRAV